MNLLLQDPFSVLKDYPEKLVHTLENPLNTECLEFSPGGDYLALGCSNGAVIIYDMDTLKPITMLGSKLGGSCASREFGFMVWMWKIFDYYITRLVY